MQERSDLPYGHASMLLLGEGSEATAPYNKYKIRLHSIRSLQFDQKVRPLSFRPEKFDLFTATRALPSNFGLIVDGWSQQSEHFVGVLLASIWMV